MATSQPRYGCSGVLRRSRCTDAIMLSITSRTCTRGPGRSASSCSALSCGPETTSPSAVPFVPRAGLVTSCKRGELDRRNRGGGAPAWPLKAATQGSSKRPARMAGASTSLESPRRAGIRGGRFRRTQGGFPAKMVDWLRRPLETPPLCISGRPTRSPCCGGPAWRGWAASPAGAAYRACHGEASSAPCGRSSMRTNRKASGPLLSAFAFRGTR